jgi:hypothetical protein
MWIPFRASSRPAGYRSRGIRLRKMVPRMMDTPRANTTQATTINMASLLIIKLGQVSSAMRTMIGIGTPRMNSNIERMVVP